MVYSLSTVLPLTDAYRFIKYYRELDFRRSVFKDFIKMVFTLAEDLRHKHWHNRNKRCLKNSSKFARLRIIDGAKREYVFIDRRFKYEEISGLIAQHDEMLANEPGRLFKQTGKRSISELRSSSEDIFIKGYRYSVWNKILSLIGIHPARKEWFAASGLNVRRVKTIELISLVEKRDLFFNWVNESYVVMRKINAEPTNKFLMNNFSRRIKETGVLESKIRFIRQFALAIKSLHQKGIFHHDLKSNNVLIKSPDLFHFIDLDRVSFNRETTLQERITNLAQLNAAVTDVITTSDRLRFYRFYSYGEEYLPWKDRKDIIKQVMQATARRRHFWPLPG